ncbi:DUF2807 domain-containing protein [Flammeovirga sp. SubArs3]|uniref:GIN domain-containing protein n=1 Tax=Flammeovirga sp. SubArs3 TaxID=2995316 RepID=UPI00248B2050|nr:DUF2807 domain-containing protein [Flammeovirga sp. SubArs3]
MKQILLILSLAVLFSCNNESSNEAPKYHKIRIQNANVVIQYGDSFDYELTNADPNLQMSYFDKVMQVSGSNSGETDIIISLPDLDSVGIASKGKLSFSEGFTSSAPSLFISGIDDTNIYAESEFNIDTLYLDISSSSQLSFHQLKAEKLAIDVTSNGNANIEGMATYQQIRAFNGGHFNMQASEEGWKVENPVIGNTVYAYVGSGGTAWVQATDYLESTNGNVYYKGEPKEIKGIVENKEE